MLNVKSLKSLFDALPAMLVLHGNIKADDASRIADECSLVEENNETELHIGHGAIRLVYEADCANPDYYKFAKAERREWSTGNWEPIT